MLDEVPNFGFVFGYTNASWTLKADISGLYFGLERILVTQ